MIINADSHVIEYSSHSNRVNKQNLVLINKLLDRSMPGLRFMTLLDHRQDPTSRIFGDWHGTATRIFPDLANR